MLGPQQSPIYFCMNQFHKFHRLELRNLILAYFKNQRKCENCLPERKGQQILLENGFLGPKKKI